MKILVVKIGAIGDVIMALPIIHEIKSKYPQSEITWICGSIVYPILREIAIIDKLFSISERSLFNSGIFKRIIEIFKIWAYVFFKRYDVELILHVDDRYKLFTIPSFSKVKRKLERGAFKRQFPVPGRHHSYEYIRLFLNQEIKEPLKIVYPALKPDFDILNRFNLLQTKEIIIIAPGGAKNYLNDDFLRRWPIENYVELSLKLISKGYHVILIGSESDKWVEHYFINIGVESKIGKYSLLDTVALLSLGKLLITHDSGPLHLSILANIKCIGLFGPTSPYEKIPFENCSYIWGGENLPCRPCYDGKTYGNCSDNICLREISSDRVLIQINEIFSE